MDREYLSVTIIAQNEESRIKTCIDSVAFADEVIVVDSGSVDRTLVLAEQAGARVFHQDWLGYGRQKQFAVDVSSHEWVMCIDADERVSSELRVSVERVLKDPTCFVYRMARRNRFMGRWLRHGEGYPDWSLRLFHRKYAQWSDDRVHEKVETEVEVGTLSGDLLHESQETMAQYLQKQDRYTTIQAELMRDTGNRGSVMKLIFSPLVRFLKFYIFRLGFLDGVPGLVHILIGCQNSMNKQLKLFGAMK